MSQIEKTKTFDVVWKDNGMPGLQRARVVIVGVHRMENSLTCVHLRNTATKRIHLVRMIDLLEGDTNDFIHIVDSL
jgi:hypothetical protein